jgi:hypothetical protein
VVARLKINRKLAGLVKKSSVARLMQKNFVVGDWEIELSAGKEYAPAADEGDTIVGDCPLQLDATLHQIAVMVSSVDSLVCGIRNGQGLIGQLIAGDSLDEIAGKIKERSSKLMKDIDMTLVSANSMISNISMFGESGRTATDSFQVFATEAMAFLDDADCVFRRLDTIAQDIQTLPPGADSLLAGLQREITEADTLIRALKEHWLFRRGIRRMRKTE